MKYYEYIQSMRCFIRRTLLTSCSTICWEILTEPNNPYKQIINSYVPRVFSISAAIGNEHRSKKATIKDAIRLANDWLEVRESASNQGIIDNEAKIFLECILKSSLLKKYDISEELTNFIVPYLFFPRYQHSQLDNSTNLITCFVRNWIIYKFLKKKGSIYQIGQEPIHACRSIFGAFVCARDQKGMLDINKLLVDNKFSDEYQIDLDTVKLIVSRMSTSKEEIRNWHNNVLKLPDHYRKFAPLPLYQNPLVLYGDIQNISDGGENKYYCPSPIIFMKSAGDFLLNDFNISSSIDNNLSSNIGYAIEEYLLNILTEMFPNCELTTLNKVYKNKTADFMIESSNATLIIESKKSIGNIEARTVFGPDHVISIWDRLMEGIEQCSETIKSYKSQNSSNVPIISIVLVNHSIFGEANLLSLFLHESKILRLLGIDYLEIWSLDDFEGIFLNYKIEDIFEAIQKKWRLINESQNATYKNFCNLPLEASKKIKNKRRLKILVNGFKELFPTLSEDIFEQTT